MVPGSVGARGLLPSDSLTKALNYVLSREASLTVFLEDPDVQPDTNHLERALIDPRHPDRQSKQPEATVHAH